MQRARTLRMGLLVAVLLVAGVGLLTWLTWDWVEYGFRSTVWRDWDVDDYTRFPAREIRNGAATFKFQEALSPERFQTIDYAGQGPVNFDEFLAANDTTAFVVIRDGTVLYEKYFNGSQRDAVHVSFSVAKSFLSTLIGIAIDEGHIRSVNDPIVEYLPEMRGKGLEAMTIRHLLNMSSGITYDEVDKFPSVLRLLSDEDRSYYFPDLRAIAIQARPDGTAPGTYYHYNNYHPLYLGMILERTTGRTVSAYLEEKLWQPLGMEYPATWSLSSERKPFELMGNGINGRAIDYAKLGLLMLNRGAWGGRQIVSEAWVIEATTPDPNDTREWQSYAAFQAEDGYYKYMWWGNYLDDGGYAFIAIGKHGQFVYVDPQRKIIIVRNGITAGNVASWPAVFHQVAEMAQP